MPGGFGGPPGGMPGGYGRPPMQMPGMQPQPGYSGYGYGAGAGGYGAPSAYNVNQYPGYGQGFQQPQLGAAPYPGPQPGYGAPSGAVPGFTAPAMQQAHQQYGGQQRQGPPPQQPPPSMHYGMAQNMMANQSLQNAQWQMWKQMGLVTDDADDERDAYEAKRRRRRRQEAERGSDYESDDEDMEEMKKKMERKAKEAEEQIKALQEKLASNDAMKDDMRAAFISELIRRQSVNGTFEETTGTVVPFKQYDAEDPVAVWFDKEKGYSIAGESWDALYDAEYMRKAIKGWGTDEAAIIAVVSTRCNSQRNKVMLEYKTAYGRDLKEDLHGDLSGNFRELILGLFAKHAEYDAWCVKKAIYGLGTDEQTLIEIMFTRTNDQIKELVAAYNLITYAKQKNPEASMEEDIKDDCSGFFKRLLISAAQGNRRLIDQDKLMDSVEPVEVEGKWTGMFQVNYPKLCNQAKCARAAEELFKAGEDKWGTDEETFNRIFSTSDFYSLRLIWDEYVKVSQRDIMNSVERETSGDYKKSLLAIAQCVKCRPMFFAERLYKSMKGLGTDDSTLIRIVVSRSEIDMVQIKSCFLNKYKQTLWNFIKDDTSGDYKKVLLAIVGRD